MGVTVSRHKEPILSSMLTLLTLMLSERMQESLIVRLGDAVVLGTARDLRPRRSQELGHF